jgi:hypothetical protein
MTRSREFSTQAIDGSAYDYGYASSAFPTHFYFYFCSFQAHLKVTHEPWRLTYSVGRSTDTGDNQEVEHTSDHHTMVLQRVEDYFAREDFKHGSLNAYGTTTIFSATQHMQARLQAFDRAYNINDSNKDRANKPKDVVHS